MKLTVIASLFAAASAIDCNINEANNAMGANRCDSSSQCDGNRTCSFSGWCEGQSDCPVVKKLTAHEIKCKINEADNAAGPN